SGTRVDPYQISHPLPRDRIANLETLAKSSKNFDRQDPPELQLRHDMMRAKIAVYTGGGQGASQRIARGGGLPARYADAHSTYLRGSPSAALAKADALIKEQPRNAYMHELRGDILMRANRPAEAAKAYQQAMQLDPSKSSIIQIAYGQALMSTGKADMVQQAVQQIEQGLRRDKENFIGYRYLAQAYGQLGDVADAELATAEGHFYSGEYQDAKIFAMRAQTKLKRGTPAWLRADDIIKYKPPGKKK
ncbi:MAG: tetratricopeptide repeat protein, partial [Rhizobiaceae bacterium]